MGWGRSGLALCDLLLSLGKKVFVSEEKERGCFPAALVDSYRQRGVAFEFGGHSPRSLDGADLLLVSPGVDGVRSELFRQAQVRSIPCVGELEFASWLTKADIVAITGTNGKTTTAYLAREVLSQKNKRTFLGGNIGTPFSSFVSDTKKDDIVVLEVSSFQLETIIEFKPFVAAFLNIEPDHMDRYRNFESYLQAKLNIFRNQRPEDWAVLNKNMCYRNLLDKKVTSQIVYFSNEFSNENFSCVYRIAAVFGLSRTDCLPIFSQFKGLPHRLQVVRTVKGVTFVNDSKATNPSSTIWALRNIAAPIILLAGGKDKGLDYATLIPHLRRVKKINLFGESALKIQQALQDRVDLELCPSLYEAVQRSWRQARRGDTVLFSPMCASFDMFSDYEQRGAKFIELVNAL